MTIQKIVKVENLGRFEKLSPQGNVTFEKMTLIFGQNGRGKTTLAGVLRSLATGDPAYVTERERLGAQDPPRAEVLTAAGMSTYNGGAWSRTDPNIEIFDTTFVTENVYTGDRVDVAHRKNLYDVVVGAAAVELAKHQDGIDAEQRRAAKEINDTEGALREHVQAPFSLKEFEDLVPEDGVAERLQATTTRLNSVRKAKEVISRSVLEPLRVTAVPDGVLDVLRVGVAQISEEAQARVRAHIDKHLDGRGERWLREGLQYRGDGETCPFCAQAVTGVELVESFTTYFSTVYRDHVVEVERAVNAVEQRLGEEALQTVGRTVLKNDGAIKGWGDLADLSFASVGLEDLEAAWRHVREHLLRALRQKLADPSKPQADDPRLEAAVRDFDAAREVVLAVNEEVQRANEEIGRLKREAAAGDEAALEGELRRLRNIQIRQQPEVSELCDKLAAARTRRGEAEQKKAEVKDKLKEMAEEVLGKYEEAINAYLRRFGATFSITGTKPSWAGGKTSSTYKILLNDQPLDLGDARTPKGTPCFRTALSAGDKSTLALAFFLARLDREPALSSKVVVLDDPFSSLDQFRLACTQQAICELADRAEQVIVLSHNPFFLKHIYDACPKAGLKTLHVVRGRGSEFRLEEWDIGRACRPESDVAYFNLQTYLDEGVSGDGDLRAIAKEIRICLEGALRSRFPGHFAAHGMLGTFIDAIRNADGTSPLAVLKPKLQELEDLNAYARQYHHAGVPGGVSPQPDDDELQNFVTRALAFVHGGSVP